MFSYNRIDIVLVGWSTIRDGFRQLLASWLKWPRPLGPSGVACDRLAMEVGDDSPTPMSRCLIHRQSYKIYRFFLILLIAYTRPFASVVVQLADMTTPSFRTLSVIGVE